MQLQLIAMEGHIPSTCDLQTLPEFRPSTLIYVHGLLDALRCSQELWI